MSVITAGYPENYYASEPLPDFSKALLMKHIALYEELLYIPEKTQIILHKGELYLLLTISYYLSCNLYSYTE